MIRGKLSLFVLFIENFYVHGFIIILNEAYFI